MTRLLLLALPGGAFVYAAVLALRCRHPHEVLHFADVAHVDERRFGRGYAGSIPAVGAKMARVSPGGNAGGPEANGEVRTRAMLYCTDCRRTRPHPWAGEPTRFHRTQEARPDPLTGIQRARAEAAEQALAIEQYEHEMRFFVMGEHTKRKFEGRG